MTHDQLEAMTLADRLVVLNGGQIEQIGAPLDVYHCPASTFVASFIGSPAMNLVEATVDGGTLNFGDISLPVENGSLPQGKVVVGIRPEDLRLAENGDGFTFHVEYVEELGAQRLVHGNADGNALTASLSSELPLPEDVRLTVSPDKLHFFSADTGKRLEIA